MVATPLFGVGAILVEEMSSAAEEIARKKARLAELRRAREQRASPRDAADAAPAAADLNLKNLLAAAGNMAHELQHAPQWIVTSF